MSLPLQSKAQTQQPKQSALPQLKMLLYFHSWTASVTAVSVTSVPDACFLYKVKCDVAVGDAVRRQRV